jgi:hypothetical protein
MREHASQWSLAGDAGVSKTNLFVLTHPHHCVIC